MADELDRIQRNRERSPVIQRKPPEFQEVPGETEADAAAHALLQNAGTSPASVASALSSANGATRTQAINRLQEEQGNSYVQRVLAEPHGAPGRLVGLSQPEMVNEVTQRKGSGHPLPATTQAQMEGHWGADLSGVRVHDDGEAAALSRELNADAFTVGSDIFFAAGKYEPTGSAGQGLLAHELAHVGQQTGFQALQRQAAGEEEEEQVQRQAAPEEEEEQVQRQSAPEEEEEQPAS